MGERPSMEELRERRDDVEREGAPVKIWCDGEHANGFEREHGYCMKCDAPIREAS